MNADDVEVIDKSTSFKGYFRIDHYRLRHKLFEGGWSGEMEREAEGGERDTEAREVAP